MPEPVFDGANPEEWDENDWERFLQRADVRTAKFQELFETLARHPDRDQLIAREMGWEATLKDCGGLGRRGGRANCTRCDQRFDCEAYEMLRLIAEPERLDEDPDGDDLIACFEQVLEIPAYCRAQEFAARLEEKLSRHAGRWAADDDLRNALRAGQMVPAQIAGGHGIGYGRDSLCGNIANCKRGLRSLATCKDLLPELEARGILSPAERHELLRDARQVALEINCWIETLRAKIWWR